MREIEVSVVEFGDRRHYQLQWRHPLTGKKKTKSSGIENDGSKKNRTAAERKAAELQTKLRDGLYFEPCRMSWAEFRDRQDKERLPGLAPKSRQKNDGVLNTVERILSPRRPSDITAERLSHYTATLRAEGRSEATIKSHLLDIGSTLRWAKRLGIISVVPEIEMPKRAPKSKMMKGRPITTEEYERILAAVPDALAVTKVVNKNRVSKGAWTSERRRQHEQKARRRSEVATPSWLHYIEGLWWSGLRLEESLELHWEGEGRFRVDLTGRHPVFVIPGELEKGHQDRITPMAPEFAEFLLRTPEAERMGRVFDPRPVVPGKSERLCAGRVGRILGFIGKRANVVVDRDRKRGTVKYASAHDLRRSFGERWAARVMPPVLMALMRHESIETTLRFYVGRNAQSLTQAVWDGYRQATSNTLGNTQAASPSFSAEIRM